MAERLIQLQNIHKQYGDKTVLENLNLYVKDKEFVTLLGPSGCGKTTTLRIIGGFESPDSGTVLFEGNDITDVPPHQRQVNTVFQRYALFPHLNVYDNIAFGLRIAKMPEEEIRERVTEMLQMINLTGYEKSPITKLSGGEQQRVAIARAMVHNPYLLLADEPTGNLDPANAEDVFRIFKEINARGTTVVMATHNPDFYLNSPFRRLVLDHGELLNRDMI